MILFCSNPKCKLNILVSENCRAVMNVIDYEKSFDPVLYHPSYKPIITKTVERHLWRDPKKWAADFFLCDDCHNLAKYLQGAVL